MLLDEGGSGLFAPSYSHSHSTSSTSSSSSLSSTSLHDSRHQQNHDQEELITVNAKDGRSYTFPPSTVPLVDLFIPTPNIPIVAYYKGFAKAFRQNHQVTAINVRHSNYRVVARQLSSLYTDEMNKEVRHKLSLAIRSYVNSRQDLDEDAKASILGFLDTFRDRDKESRARAKRWQLDDQDAVKRLRERNSKATKKSMERKAEREEDSNSIKLFLDFFASTGCPPTAEEAIEQSRPVMQQFTTTGIAGKKLREFLLLMYRPEKVVAAIGKERRKRLKHVKQVSRAKLTAEGANRPIEEEEEEEESDQSQMQVDSAVQPDHYVPFEQQQQRQPQQHQHQGMGQQLHPSHDVNYGNYPYHIQDLRGSQPFNNPNYSEYVPDTPGYSSLFSHFEYGTPTQEHGAPTQEEEEKNEDDDDDDDVWNDIVESSHFVPDHPSSWQNAPHF